jgi:hypothetical protein
MVGRASVLERKKRGGTTVQRCEGGARRGHQDVAASGVAVETRGRRPKLFFEGGDNEAAGDMRFLRGTHLVGPTVICSFFRMRKGVLLEIA